MDAIQESFETFRAGYQLRKSIKKAIGTISLAPHKTSNDSKTSNDRMN